MNFFKKSLIFGTSIVCLPLISSFSTVDIPKKVLSNQINMRNNRNITNLNDCNVIDMFSPDKTIKYELRYLPKEYSVYQLVDGKKVFIEGDLNLNIKDKINFREDDTLIYGGLSNIYVEKSKNTSLYKLNNKEVGSIIKNNYNFDIRDYMDIEKNTYPVTYNSVDHFNEHGLDDYSSNIDDYKLIKNWKYFYNLKSFPNNTKGTCGIVAISILMGYFDKYYDDDLIIDHETYNVTSKRLDGYSSSKKDYLMSSYYERYNCCDNDFDKIRGTTDAFQSLIGDKYLSTYLDCDNKYDWVKNMSADQYNKLDWYDKMCADTLKPLFKKCDEKPFVMDEQNIRDTITNYFYDTGRYHGCFEWNPNKRKLAKTNGKGGFYVWLNRQAGVRNNILKDINDNLPTIGIFDGFSNKEVPKAIQSRGSADAFKHKITKLKSMIEYGHDVVVYGKRGNVFLCHIGWDNDSLSGSAHAINAYILNGHCTMSHYN